MQVTEMIARFKAKPSFSVALVVLGALGLFLTFRALDNWMAQMPDFRVYEAGPERKAEFLDFVRPLVDMQNRQVLRDRTHLEEIAAKDGLHWLDRYRLHALAERYRVDTEEVGESEIIETLLRRIDAVPPSLALAQAAKESGWGTSRFAREGNNLFGERCFEPGCGLVPRTRAAGLTHEVETFATPGDSVASYLRNINVHPSYRSFRVERARLREAGEEVSGLSLVDDLVSYSERGQAYVNDIRRLIRANDLADRPDDADSDG